MNNGDQIRKRNFGKMLRLIVRDARDLPEVLARLLECLKGYHLIDTQVRFGYVAGGIISSDGAERMPQNLERLADFTEEIRRCCGDLFVFSATDIFLESSLSSRLQASGAREEDYMAFWRAVLESGLVKKIFFTPGWERSRGAFEEFEIAKRQGMEIYVLESQCELAGPVA